MLPFCPSYDCFHVFYIRNLADVLMMAFCPHCDRFTPVLRLKSGAFVFDMAPVLVLPQ